MISTLTLRNLLACTCLLLAAGGQQAQAEASSPTLEKIRATGVVYLGYREASAPFAYLDADGKALGFSPDLCRHVTDAIQARLNLPAPNVNDWSSLRIPSGSNLVASSFAGRIRNSRNSWTIP